MHLDRRRFLAALGSLPLLPHRSARASTGTPRNLLVVVAGGGWDTTYTFDPKPDSDLVDTGAGRELAFGDGRVWVGDDRPSVGTFFDRYGGLACVINGLNVPSVAHDSCMQRMLSGSRDAARPDIGAIVGHSLADTAPIPYLDVGGDARPGTLGSDSGYLGANNQLGALVFEDLAIPPVDRRSWPRVWSTDAERDLVRAYVTERAESVDARVALGRNAARHASFLEGLDRGHALANFPGFFGDLPSGRTIADQAGVALAAFEQGLSRTAIIGSPESFDTHQDNVDQVDLYESLFAGLLALMESLESTPGTDSATLLDETVVVVLSEMGRTPRLNGDAGKDHWPFTSTMVVGAGIRGDTIVGATSEALAALPIDLDTGVPDEAGLIPESQHLHAALIELFGADPAGWFPDTDPLRAVLA